MYIGYYRAAAAVCEGLELDWNKVDALVRSRLLPPEQVAVEVTPDMPAQSSMHLRTDQERGVNQEVLLMHLGMATGLVLGANRSDVTGFCADAQSVKMKVPAGSNLFKLPG